MRSRRLRPALIILVSCAALVSAGCLPVIPYTALSVNGVPRPAVDGLGLFLSTSTPTLTAATSGTAQAVGNPSIDVIGGQQFSVTLAGSWMAWQPQKTEIVTGFDGTMKTVNDGPAKWVCPEATGVTAWFAGQTQYGFLGAIGDLLSHLSLTLTSGLKPVVTGATCQSGFAGTTVTLTAPAYDAGQPTQVLYIEATSGGVPHVISLNGVETTNPAVGVLQQLAVINVNVKQASASAPTARIVSRAAPVWVAGGAFSDARTLWYEVDARQSTDGAGGALAYSWDLDGDGAYGDASATPDPTGTLPSGVAIVPVSVLTAAAAGSGSQKVGVRVTNTAGQTADATTTITAVPSGSPNDNYRSAFTLDTATPTAGATLTLTITTPMSLGGYACIDADADGVYETTVTLPHRTGSADSMASATTPALATGPHLITVVFIERYGSATCANPLADAAALTFREVYTSAATRRGTPRASAERASGYSGQTTVRLRRGRILREASGATASLNGLTIGGGYRWFTARRGNGVLRPGALGAFARGAYVSRATKLSQVGGAESIVGIGYGHALLRGSGDRDLLCLDVRSIGTRQVATIVGGSGAGARLRGTLDGAAFAVPMAALGVVDATGSGDATKLVYGQTRAFASTSVLTASMGAARPLPKACRALIALLPERSDGGSSVPSVVTG